MTEGEHNAYLYEVIMKRAYGIGMGNDDGRGPHMSDLRNLYWHEDPDKRNAVSHLQAKTIREQLRKTIRKGLDKVSKWQLTGDERSLVEQGHGGIDKAHSAVEFYAIIQLLDGATRSVLPQNH